MSSRDFNGPYKSGGGSHRSAGGRGREEYSGWGDDGFWQEPAGSRSRGARAAGMAGIEAARMGAARVGDAIRHSGAMRLGGAIRNSGAFRSVSSRSTAAGRAMAGRATAGRAGNAGSGFRANGYDGGGYSRNGYSANGGGRTTVLPGRPDIRRPGPGGPGRHGGRPGRPWGPGGPGRYGRMKVKGSWWRVWTIRKAVGVLASGVGLFILIAILGVMYAYSQTPIPSQTLAANLFQRSTVYYADGKTVIGTFGTYNRQLLTYNQIPKVVQDATVAAEDRAFWTEGGISPRGILRAAYEDTLGGGNSLQGGSTITQQYVRNYYQGIGTAQTTSRKIKEIFVAMKIGRSEDKATILTNYLNTIYLGNGAYGVAAAAQTYFHVPVSKLTVAQAAVIAAIIQQPTNYPLPQFRQQLEGRWHYVLGGMVQMGDLTAEQAATMKFPDNMGTGPLQSVGKNPWDPYILVQVHNELEASSFYGLSEQEIATGGLKIVTTINRSMTAKLYQAVQQNVKLMKQSGGKLKNYDLIGAELQDPQTGAILAEFPGPGQKTGCNNYCFNNTVISREQVGSSFKPYVLAAAVQAGMNVQTSTLNGGFATFMNIPGDTTPQMQNALSMPNPAGTQAAALAAAPSGTFPIENDDGAIYKAMNVQDAFAQSSNVAFTDLYHKVGGAAVVNFAQSVGVDVHSSLLKLDKDQVGTALGQNSLSVNEQDTMLSALANGGTFHTGHVINQVTTGTSVLPAKYMTSTVLTQEQVSQVQYAMSTVTVNGTGTQAAMDDGRPIIAKTGTTSNFHSGFFLGAIPQAALTVGIFTQNQGAGVGCDKNGLHCKGPNPQSLDGLGGTTLGQTGFGGYWPARIWHTFMQSAYGNSPIQQFLPPQFAGDTWDQVGNLQTPNKHRRGGLNGFPIGGNNGGLPGLPPISGLPVNGTGNTIGTGTVNGTQTGVAAGGTIAVLPVALLWNVAGRRRSRRRKRAGSGRLGRFPS